MTHEEILSMLGDYVDYLIANSSAEAPMWNIEKVRSGKPNKWNYIDGCMITACLSLYKTTGDEKYLEFSKEFIDYFVQPDGSIKTYDPKEYNLDNVNQGKNLFILYDIYGDEKYRKAIDTIRSQLLTQPRTKEGNFWHKDIYPWQVWLDGTYMAQPFYMEYETRFNKMQGCIDSYKQFMNIKKHMRDEKTGLYYHGYDESRQMYWADPETGCSPNFWLRAMGWFLVAMVDVLERMDEQLYNEYRGIMAMLKQAVEDMHKFQDEQTGMFWQVIDHPEAEGNYLETSGTALFAYAVLKGVRLGYLPKRKELEQESRHLGLDFSRSKETEGLDMLAGLLEEHVDWELLLSTIGLPLPAAAVEEKSVLSEPGKLHISVARNEESFSFLYAEHLDILRCMGTVTFFNPEQDRAIPQETDLLYLPGGYPENRLEELAGARLARESIRSYIEAGGRTLAECGGMIYLSQSVLSDGDTDGGGSDTDGRSTGNSVSNVGNEMVGVLPFSITNERKRRKLTLGYRRFDYNGWRLKGHEFHYTQLAVPEAGGKESGAYSLTPSIVQVFNARGEKVATPIFRYKNLIASYTHLYWGEMDVMSLFGGA